MKKLKVLLLTTLLFGTCAMAFSVLPHVIQHAHADGITSMNCSDARDGYNSNYLEIVQPLDGSIFNGGNPFPPHYCFEDTGYLPIKITNVDHLWTGPYNVTVWYQDTSGLTPLTFPSDAHEHFFVPPATITGITLS